MLPRERVWRFHCARDRITLLITSLSVINMKKTLFLTVLLGFVAVASTAEADTVVLIPNESAETDTLDANAERLLFTPGQETTYKGTVNLQRTSGSIWIGPSNDAGTGTVAASAHSVVNLTGNLTGSSNASWNEYSSAAGANAILTLSGTASTYSGTLSIGHGGWANSISQVALLNGASLANATISTTDNKEKCILSVEGNATIGGLSSAGDSAITTSSAASNTLTLAGSGTYTYGGKIGATNTSYYGHTLDTAATATSSTALSITKRGTGTQTLNGAANLNVLTLNNGTLVFGADSSASKLEMDGGTLTINTGKTLTVNANNANMVLLTGGTVNGGGKLFINAGKYSGNTTIDLSTVAAGTTISLKQAKGTLKAATNNIVAANIELTNGDWAAAEWTTVEGSAYTFTGAISSAANSNGNFVISHQNKEVALTFSGDLSGWTSGNDQWSGLRVNNSATVNAVLNGTPTNEAVGTAFNRGDGYLNLTIDRNATFSKRLDLTSLTVKAGKTVSTSNIFFKTAAKVELGNNASLTIENATDTNVGTFVGLGDNAHLTLSGTTNLKVTDSSSGQGVWINAGADVTIQDSAQINVANGALTISKVVGADAAKISRLNPGATAKLGVTKNSDSSPVFLKNVKVANAVVNYEGSDILYLGSMQGGTLSSTGNIEFAGVDSSIGTLTLNGNSITLGTAASHNATLTLNNLKVTAADSAINADLVLNNGGTITMSHAVTMGCSVTIGNGETLVLTNADYTDNVLQNYILFTGVDSLTLGSGDPVAQGWYDASTVLSSLSINGGEAITSNLDNYVIGYWNGTVSISDKSVPEPATATLSLLALAGLAARRRRH